MRFFKGACIILSDFLLKVHNKFSHKNVVKPDYTKERKIVADIIADVLVGNLCVREALLKFPKDCDDVCCAVAWHAVLHFEADEDIAAKDDVFRDVQVDFLEGLYKILSTGGELPEKLLDGYNKYHKGVDTCQCSSKEYFWHEMKRNISLDM